MIFLPVAKYSHDSFSFRSPGKILEIAKYNEFFKLFFFSNNQNKDTELAKKSQSFLQNYTYNITFSN